MGVKQVAPWHHKGQGARWKRPLAHRRPGYPLAGCSPAEPTSVSPGDVDVPQGPPAHKSKQAAQASWERVAVTRAALSVAKERSFFVQTMGSTSVAASTPNEKVTVVVPPLPKPASSDPSGL